MTSGCFRISAQCVVRQWIYAQTSSCLWRTPKNHEFTHSKDVDACKRLKHFPGSDIIASRLDVLCPAIPWRSAQSPPHSLSKLQCVQLSSTRDSVSPDGRQDSSWDSILVTHTPRRSSSDHSTYSSTPMCSGNSYVVMSRS